MQKTTIFASFVCLFVCFMAQGAYGVQYFEAGQTYHVHSYPIGIASGDFNGDGYPDLVTGNNQGSSVSVLINDGDGTFATRVDYDCGSSMYQYFVETGDMDGDGNIDIVTGGSMGIVIFYGAGDGTFAPADVYYFGEAVLDLAIADFNKDSYLDIATSHAVRDSVGIHLNDGDSTYTTHMLATCDGTISLAQGNLDGDSWIDLLVGCNQGRVWNLKNDQSGSFTPTEVHIGLLSDPANVAVTDLNGDNIGDYAVTHSVNDFLFPYFNDGAGTYTVGTGYTLTDNPGVLTFADVNGDNEDDILVCIGTTNEIELYLNQGSGTFSKDSSYATTGTPKDIVFADFDGDGYQDMAATSHNFDDAVVFISRLSLISGVEDIDDDGILPQEFTLEQNYPNPFNPKTNIRFSLPRASDVTIEIFNSIGQSVAVLVDDYLTAGVKEITWNGLNDSGNEVSSGVYFYRITTDHFSDSKAMVLLK